MMNERERTHRRKTTERREKVKWENGRGRIQGWWEGGEEK